jgi:hypothetical protein
MASTIDPKTGLPITNQPISTSALSTPQTPFTVVPPADTTPILTSAINTASGTTQQALDVATAEQAAQQARDKQMSESNTIADLTRMTGNKSTDLSQAYQTGGVNDLFKQISGYNTQAQGLVREATAIPLQTGQAYQGSSGTQAGVASVNRDLLQRNALQSLTLAQSAAIAQGNYDVAKNLADQQVNAKYAQIDAEIAARKINEEALYKNVTDPAIKKALEARMALTKKEEQMQAEKKAAETAVNNMLIEASPVAPPDVLQRAKDIQAKGGTAVEVAKALGQYGGDYYKTALLKEQIETQKSQRATDAVQRAKAYQDIAESKSKMGGVGGTIDPTTGKPVYLDPKVIDNPTFKLAQSLTPVKTAIQAYKDAINKYGAYEMADSEGRGAINSTYGNALAAWKTMAGLGALSGADFVLAENAIPEPAIFSRNATSISKLDNSLANANSQIGTYVKTLKTAYPKSVSGIDATINQSATVETPKIPNKFNSALGKSDTPIMGTTYVNKVGDDGSIDFNIPTK